MAAVTPRTGLRRRAAMTPFGRMFSVGGPMAIWRRLHNWLALPLLVALIVLAQQPALAGTVKIGVLKFGTVSWELDTIKTHGLDKAEGLNLQVVELANTN